MPTVRMTIRREVTTICECIVQANVPSEAMDDYGALSRHVEREIIYKIPPNDWASQPVTSMYYSIRDYTIDSDNPRD